jgi:3-phosphoshikimate 1-carboxyvinyltransferase
MGAQIEIQPHADQGGEPTGDLLVRHSALQATTVSGARVVRMIDEFPAFAMAAAFAEGTSVVTEAEELRHKESDRIGALVSELGKLGVQAAETEDGFSISGGKLPSGGLVDPHGDHRLAMALALAGLAGRGAVMVSNAQLIGESFPEFPQVLASLGADIRMEPGA